MALVLVVGGAEHLSEIKSALGKRHEMIHVENASQAMEALEQDPNVLIVNIATSESPVADFVSRIRSDNMRLPVVLISRQGEEQSVVQALRKGASSYVPSELISQELPATIRHVLAYSREDDSRSRMLAQMRSFKCEFRLESDRSLIPPLVSYLQDHIGRLKICGPSELVRVGIALDEALANALYHGNLELDSELREDGDVYYELAEKRSKEPPYAERTLTVDVDLARDRAIVVIRDEGPGFDPESLADPRDPANMDRVSGRGILLMRTFMDQVEFNEVGNQVTLRKDRVQPDS